MPPSNTSIELSYYLFSPYREQIRRLCYSSDCLINDLERIEQDMKIRIEDLYILLGELAAIEAEVAKSKEAALRVQPASAAP